MKVKIYDQPKTLDRYTVIYNNAGDYVAMSEFPYHPQGFGQHGEKCTIGKHLGKRIKFKQLPVDCQKLVQSELAYYGATIL